MAVGMDFFALALIAANNNETPLRLLLVRLVLAGLCVGMNIMEGADIGALCSLCIAAFVVFKAFVDSEKSAAIKFIKGAWQVMIIALFTAFIACQTIISLVGTQIHGISGTNQESETKAQHWNWATQWSLPKKETLGIVVPGLFGYKMDTPKDMMPQFQNSFEGGEYWGGIGRDPSLDHFLDTGGEGTPPPGFMRFTGGGNYCGILVILTAAWAVAQAFRRQQSAFSAIQKKFIWFWMLMAIVCLLLAWGRFAPGSHSYDGFMFYSFLYKLPYFSTIRNPIKFLIFLSWAVVILFAYGIHGVSRLYLDSASPRPLSMANLCHDVHRMRGRLAGLLGTKVGFGSIPSESGISE
jgi:hypothetical protein